MSRVSELLPGPSARGPGQAYAEGVWSGVDQLFADTESLRNGLHDLNDATGLALDIQGDWVGEQRLELLDAPYRRLIAGRRVAIAGGVVPHAVLRGWEALTGDENATITEAPAEAILQASVSYLPGDAWLARAGAVVRDLMPNGREVYGVISAPGTFIWGQSTFDSAGFAFDVGGV